MRYLLIVIVLAAAVVAALFTVPAKNGEPLLDWQHVEQNWQEPQTLIGDGPDNLLKESGETTLFRWRDPQGNWQYGQIPPPGVDAEEMTIKSP